jgi:hypothetical protein
MIKKELDNLKYELYKKSWKSDYITYNQFIENQNVAFTFWELQKREQKKKKTKKVLKIDKKYVYINGNM